MQQRKALNAKHSIKDESRARDRDGERVRDFEKGRQAKRRRGKERDGKVPRKRWVDREGKETG